MIKFGFFVLSCLIVWIIYCAEQGALPYVLYRVYRFPGGDKLGHFLAMGFIVLTLGINILSVLRKWRIFSVCLVAVITAIYATYAEFSQQYIFYRTFSYYDLVSGYLGIVFLGMIPSILVAQARYGNEWATVFYWLNLRVKLAFIKLEN
ncbi:VanZ family protein [Zooshikella marina]|uniref:VanZ family protein n=1 Tax=Zooshikella ganghwensis TaxID=202772 RepID=UPI001BAFB6CA|nr:VanZ family protein [Zooshikella ganghwensis]MBU2705885.1 VanZ family protein [Zooshikella ganghwensis]